MADADWHRYRQLRGRPLPEAARWLGAEYRCVKVLKRDFYAAVGIYERAGEGEPRQVLYKVYHTDPFWGVPLGWLGRWLAGREVRHYELLRGVEGVPQLLSRDGESGLVREFYPGCNLREYRAHSCPGEAYFGELKRILAAIHARGMSHNDLSKPENVLVREDGRPGVIDLQIALAPRGLSWPVVGALLRAVLRYFQGVDRYHVDKLHWRARPEDFSGAAGPGRKGLLLVLHGWLLRMPYRAARRFVVKPLLLEEKRRAG